MVILRDPARSVLKVREHRKRAGPPFAGPHGLNVDPSQRNEQKAMMFPASDPWTALSLAGLEAPRLLQRRPL